MGVNCRCGCDMFCSDEIEINPKRTEILEQAKANIICAQQRQKKVYDRKHNPEVGSLVLKKDFT